MTNPHEEPRVRVSEFERELFARLKPFEQFQVLTLLESGISRSVRDALAEIRAYQEHRS